MHVSKTIIIPGNGDSRIESDNWYAWVKDALQKRGFKVVAKNMPDPVLARAKFWIPFIEEDLAADENSIIIGHSSGAVATLRYLETHKLLGAILIGCNYTDLGDETEAKSGYYDTKWQWEKIKENASWIVQFASADDPYIPIEQPRYIHEKTSSQLLEFKDRGHFEEKTFPELLDVIAEKTA